LPQDAVVNTIGFPLVGGPAGSMEGTMYQAMTIMHYNTGWWFGNVWNHGILFSISYMGWNNPSHSRTPSFFKMCTLHHQPV